MAKQTVIALSPEARAALTKRYADRGTVFNADTYVKGARVFDAVEALPMGAEKAPVADRVNMYRALVAKTGLSQGEEDLKMTLKMYTPVEEYQKELRDQQELETAREAKRVIAGLRAGANAARMAVNAPTQEETPFTRPPNADAMMPLIPVYRSPDMRGVRERAESIDAETRARNSGNARRAEAPLPVSRELKRAFAKQDREQGFASFGISKPFSKNPVLQNYQLSALTIGKTLGDLASRFSTHLFSGE